MSRIATAASCATLLLTGCSGAIVTTPLSQADLGKAVNGIVVYRTMPIVEVDALTQISDTKKTETNNCRPALTRKIVSVVDYNHPFAVAYEHGLLESYTFAVTLNSDGVLLSVNTQSTPDQGKTLGNLTTAASTAAGIMAKGLEVTPPGGKKQPSVSTILPPCTTTPVFQNYEKFPTEADFHAFGSTQPPASDENGR